MSETESKVHKFEIAGLGKAPFRVVGFDREVYVACHGAPAQPGASCDYCGQAIMNVARIRSADGKTFKVGCKCVYKTGDAGLVDRVRRAERKMSDLATRIDVAGRTLGRSEVMAALSAKPHPNLAGRSLADYVAFLLDRAGATGKAKACKIIEAAVEALDAPEA